MPGFRLPAASLAAALALFPFAARPATAHAPEEVLPLGSTWVAEVSPDGSPSTLGVLLAAGTAKGSVLVKIAKGSSLVPMLAVVRPDGTVLDQAALAAAGATVKASAKAVKVTNLPIPASGLYRFLVRGSGGTDGGYSIKVSGKPSKGLAAAGSIATAATKVDHVVDLPQNAYVTIKLKPSKATPFGPSLDILPPSGAAIDYTPLRVIGKDDSINVKGFYVPYFGRMTFRVGSAAGTGDYTLSVKWKAGAPPTSGGLPTADAGADLVLAPGKRGSFAASGTGGSTFAWEQVSGPPVVLSGRTTASPTVTAPLTRGLYAWQVTTKNTTGYSAPDIAFLHVDRVPVASAGPAQAVASGATVTLDGSGSSDGDPGDPMYFRWTQVAGPSVTLADPFAAVTTFVPTTAGVLVFDLTVSDGVAVSATDRVAIAVGGGGAAADAGLGAIVTPMDTVFLSGARSIAADGGSPSTFLWTRVDGGTPPVTLAGADGPVASFQAPKVDATLRFRLVVDGSTAGADEVTVHVDRSATVNATPVARAGGRQVVTTGAAVVLDGTASSDADGHALTREWMQLSGEDGGLADRTAASASATAPATAGIQRYLLMVHDGRKYSAPDIAHVVAGAPNTPAADAGPDVTVAAGAPATLTSSGTLVAEGRTVASRVWTQTSGRELFDVDAEDPGFSPGAASPQFTVPLTVSSLTQDRVLTFSLVVTDDAGAQSLADTVAVNVLGLPPNAQPQVTASVSAPAVRPGTVVTAQAVGSDADGDALTYAWSQISGPPVALGGATTSAATFTAPVASGTVVLRVTVDDGTGSGTASNSDEVSVIVNQAPGVVATADPVSAPQGSVITLSGVGTTDPEAETLAYRWVEINVPAGGPVTLADPNAQTTTFTVPAYSGSVAQRRRTFRLEVTDGLGSGFVTTATVQFTPNAGPVLNAIVASGDRKIIYDNTDFEGLTASPTTDADGDALTFTWRIVAGPQKINSYLSSTQGASVNFRVPAPSGNTTGSLVATGGVYTIGVVASDGAVQSAEATIDVLAYPSFATHLYNAVLNTGTCATASCHGSGSGGGLRLDQGASTAITNLLNGRVTKNSYNSSSLHSNVNSGTMPKGMSKLPEFRIEMIRNWIEPDMNGGSSNLSAGAENN